MQRSLLSVLMFASVLAESGFRRGTPAKRVRTPGPRGASRYPAAQKGGNWQGKPYLTYAEHDQCVRAGFKYISCGQECCLRG